MQSRAVVMDDGGSISTESIEVPEIGPNEVLVRVELTGICGSDVHMRSGGMELDYPVVPGHELAGEIEALGENVATDSKNDPVSEGDAVTVVPGYNVTDDWYTTHVPNHPLACTDRNVYGFRGLEEYPHAHGGMSQYLIVEEDAFFYRLPDDVQTELGAIVEPLSVGQHAVELGYQPGIPWAREGFGIGQCVCVQGSGPIGILAGATARHAGAGQVIMLDLIEERLELAKEFGATDTVDIGDFDDDEFIEEVHDLSPSGDGADIVIEAVGHPSALEQSLDLARSGGTIVEVGHYAYTGEAELNPTQMIHRELTIHGSLAYPPTQFETAISMLGETKDDLPYLELFNHQVGLSDARSAYDAQEAGEAYRATIHPWK